MESSIIEYLKLTLQTRLARVAAVCVVAYVGIFLYVRQMQIPYIAEINVFVTAGQSGLSMIPSSMLDTGISAIERDTFIAGQEVLAKSRSAYEEVQARLAGMGIVMHDDSESVLKKLGRLVQRLFFVDADLETAESLRDAEFQRYRDAISFTAQLDSGSFIIRYRHRDLNMAVATAELLAQSLIDINQRLHRAQMEKVSSFLKRKVDEQSKVIEDSSRKLAAFMTEQDYSDSTAVIDTRYRLFLESQQAVERGEVELRKADLQLQSSRDFIKSLEEEAGTSDRSKRRIRAEVVTEELRKLEASMASGFGPDDADTQKYLQAKAQALSDQLDVEHRDGAIALSYEKLQDLLGWARQVASQAESSSIAWRAQLVSLKTQRDERLADVSRFPQLQARLSQMMLVHTQMRKVLENLTEQYLSASVQGDVQLSKLYMVDKASVARHLIGALKIQLLVACCVAATLVIFFLVAVTDSLRGTILSSRQISRSTARTLLGAFPLFPKKRFGTIATLCAGNQEVIRMAQVLRQSLRSGAAANSGRVLVCTSYDSSDGKSVTSLGLAMGLAVQNKSVLLLDCDFRAVNRSVLNYFGANVAGDAAARSITLADGSTRSFKKSHNAPLFYGRGYPEDVVDGEVIDLYQATNAMLKGLRSHFDYIMLDGPPIALVESLLLVEEADGIIVCCPEGEATASRLEEVLETVEQRRRSDADVFVAMTKSRFKINQSRIMKSYNYRAKAA